MEIDSRISKAAKVFLTVFFILFLLFLCLEMYLPALAALIIGIGGFIALIAAGLRLAHKEERHFIRNIMPEYVKLCQSDYSAAVKFLESELEYSRKNTKFGCNKNYLGILLAAHCGNARDMAKCSEYIDSVSPEELKRDGELDWLIVYYSVKMDIAMINGDHSLAKEQYERLCGEIEPSGFENNMNMIKMRSSYLLLCGNYEGALREADKFDSGGMVSRMTAFQCRLNALINLRRLDEAEELIEKTKCSDIGEILEPCFEQMKAAVERKRESAVGKDQLSS